MDSNVAPHHNDRIATPDGGSIVYALRSEVDAWRRRHDEFPAFAGTFATPGRTLSGAAGPGSYQLNVAAVNACGASAATPSQTVVIP
jgi:hypothetical protein